MNELKKCPFCGHEVKINEGYIIMFICKECGAMVSFDINKYLNDREKTIEAYNHRESEEK